VATAFPGDGVELTPSEPSVCEKAERQIEDDDDEDDGDEDDGDEDDGGR
jgi:hypothetical protein